MTFLKKYKDIHDLEICQEEDIQRNGSKTMIVATKRIYI